VFVGFVRDLSDHLRAEEAAAAAAAAVETSRLQNELLNTVSHELRTPLAAIKGFATAMLAFPDRLSPEERRSFLHEIDGAADRLGELVENLLQLARLESGTLRIERAPVSLVSVLGAVVAEARRRHPDRVITLDLPRSLPLIVADGRRLGQVAANLIENAVKFSPKGGEVEVCARRMGNGVEFSVTDHGIGIAPRHHEHIFERFYRVDTGPARDIGGTGLGLAICRRIVNEHGGAITLASQEGEGTTFTVCLPVARA
jgi:signal transduction histidine kinase